MPGKIVSSNVKPLGELNPDFVLSVKYLVDQAGVPTDNSDQKFAKLVTTLREAGFYSQVRPGEDSTLLLFIKVNDSILLKALKSFHLKDYLYGVKNTIDDDEQILERLSSAEKLRAAYSLISDPKFEGGAGITPGSGEWAFVEKIIPLYDNELTKRLVTEWSKKPLIDENDIATIKDIAGEKVALYFGFLRFYTVWLVVPSVLGFVSYVFFSRYSIIFTILNLLWAIVMTNAWKKKEHVYAITWNTKDSSLIETKRGEFVGETEEIDTVTGLKAPAFPSWKRTLRELAFVPIAIGAALTLVSYQFGCFFIEIFLNEIYQGPGKQFLSFVPTILIVGFIPVLTAGYTIFVDKFLAWENHDTNTSYERSFVQKQFILNFLASYMPLLITSFVYLPFGYLVNPYLSFIQTHTSKYNIAIQENKFQINKDRLNQQFAYFAVTAQVVGFLMENIVPVVLRKVTEYFRAKKETNSAAALTDLPEEAQFLQEVRKQVALPPFNVNDEYREMVIQFGYLAIFGPVWSLAPIVSLVNNWVEFRGDAYKLFNETQRPIPAKADTISPWNTNLRFLTWLATLVSPAITALFRQSDILEESEGSYLKSPVRIPAWSLFAIILLTEHISIALNFLVETVYNKIGTKTEKDFQSNVYQTRRQYIDGYLQQTNSTGELDKRGTSIDPTEQYWENFSDEEVIKHANIIPKQVLDAVVLRKEKEEAEQQEARVLAEKKKAKLAQEKAHEAEISNANAQASNSSYQKYSENGDSNLQSRSTTASSAVPGPAASAISGAAFAAGAVVGAAGALTGGKDSQDAQTGENAQSVPGVPDPSTHQSRSTAPQTSQGYPAEYNTSGTSKIPSEKTVSGASGAQQHASRETSSVPSSNAQASSGSGAAIGAGAVGAGAAGAGIANTSNSHRFAAPNENSASETSSVPSKASDEKKGGFFSKFSKKDTSSVAKGAKDDATKFSSQGQGIASDVKKGDYSSAKKFAADAHENPDKYVGNTREALNQSKGGTSGSAPGTSTGTSAGPSASSGAQPSSQTGKSGSSGYGTGAGAAAGAGLAGAGVAVHESSKSGSSSHPNSSSANTSSGYKDQSSSSSKQPQTSGYNSKSTSAQGTNAAHSNDAEPQSDSVNPYNAVPRDSQPKADRGSEATTAGSGAVAGGAAGAAGTAGAFGGSGSNEDSAVSTQKEEKKGGFFSKFSKKDASSVAKGAKDDATKFSSQGQGIASDVKKGDYSSAKKFAADAHENPDKYVGNTRAAANDVNKTSASGSGVQDTSKGASQVPTESSSSGHGISGKETAAGAGIAGVGGAGAGYAAHDSHKKSAHSEPQGSSLSGDQQEASSSGFSNRQQQPPSSSADTSGSTAAGATLPPHLSGGSNGQTSKNASGAGVSSSGSKHSGQGSTTGYTGADVDAFANQPSHALKNSDAKGYTSSKQAQGADSHTGTQQQGSQSGKSHSGTEAGVAGATGAAVGAGATGAVSHGSGSGSGSHSHSQDKPHSTEKNAEGIPQNLSNPFTDGTPLNKASAPSDDAPKDQKTLDPKSGTQGNTSSGSDRNASDPSASKPSKVAATEESHPTSTGIDSQDKQSSGGFGLGGIAAGLAGAAGATGLASRFGGSANNTNEPTETKEGKIPGGGQEVSSNLAKDAGGNSYLDTAKGYAEEAGTGFNDYVQVAAQKADEYAKNSDNQYINQGNKYVQELAEKSDDYAKQHGGSTTGTATKKTSDSSGSAGAAATKGSSGGKDSTASAATGTATGSSSGPGAQSGSHSNGVPSSAAAQFANKKHSDAGRDEDQSESLPQHFQHENKNPFNGKVGPVPGTEDQVIPHTKASDISQGGQGYENTHGSSKATQSDTLQPPKATGGDTDSASSSSSPKKKGFLSKVKQKIKGDSAPNSANTTPKKGPAPTTA